MRPIFDERGFGAGVRLGNVLMLMMMMWLFG